MLLLCVRYDAEPHLLQIGTGQCDLEGLVGRDGFFQLQLQRGANQSCAERCCIARTEGPRPFRERTITERQCFFALIAQRTAAEPVVRFSTFGMPLCRSHHHFGFAGVIGQAAAQQVQRCGVERLLVRGGALAAHIGQPSQGHIHIGVQFVVAQVRMLQLLVEAYGLELPRGAIAVRELAEGERLEQIEPFGPAQLEAPSRLGQTGFVVGEGRQCPMCEHIEHGGAQRASGGIAGQQFVQLTNGNCHQRVCR